jgi:hypothetical protein
MVRISGNEWIDHWTCENISHEMEIRILERTEPEQYMIPDDKVPIRGRSDFALG